jgi:phenylalanyl-tRNA synthetase beta chain
MRLLLTSLGVAEASTTSLMGAWELDLLALPADHPARRTVALANPMSEQEDVLRTTLLPGLLRSAARNLAAHRTSVALFEVARIYEPSTDEIPWQPVMIGGVFSGIRSPKGWNAPETRWDFFSAKGVLEGLVQAAGAHVVFDTAQGMPFHPTRAATISLGPTRLGSLGELHPEVCDNFDVAEGTCVFEIALVPLIDALPGREQAREVMRHPSVYLDVAVVVDENVPSTEVAAMIAATGEPEVVSVRLFDLYRGEQVSAGKKSLAFALELRVDDRTLTDEEANAVRSRIVDSLGERLQATLRT